MAGCWEWTRGKCSSGYGSIRVKDKKHRVHRLFYETCFGPVPKGLQLDHLCRNRWCCNPDHMEAVTQQENIRRGLTGKLNNHNARKTRCPRGHEYTEENTYIQRVTGGRQCLICKHSLIRKYHDAVHT